MNKMHKKKNTIPEDSMIMAEEIEQCQMSISPSSFKDSDGLFLVSILV